MTLSQWLRHLVAWLRCFPLPNDSGHCWIGEAGEPHCWCLVCDAEKDEEEDAYCGA